MKIFSCQSKLTYLVPYENKNYDPIEPKQKCAHPFFASMDTLNYVIKKEIFIALILLTNSKLLLILQGI